MNSTTTLTEQRRMIINSVQQKAQELLQWTSEQYAGYLYQTGLDYLKAYFGSDAWSIRKLEGRKEFWNWFTNQWSYRDLAFNECEHIDEMPLPDRLAIYRELNNPKILAAEIGPNRVVLGSDFSIIQTELPC